MKFDHHRHELQIISNNLAEQIGQLSLINESINDVDFVWSASAKRLLEEAKKKIDTILKNR